MSFALISSPKSPPSETPIRLGDFLRSRVEENSEFWEINASGSRSMRRAGDLHDMALEISKALKHTVSRQSHLVLCFENALDFIPAAWASVYGGYSWMPWHLLTLSSEKGITSKLELIRKNLYRPVLLTTAAIGRRMSKWSGLFEDVLSIDSEADLTFAHEISPRDLGGGEEGMLLVPTSGTTGSPKIAMIDNDCLLRRLVAREGKLSSGSRLVSDPFENVGGLGILTASAKAIYLQPERVAAKPEDYLCAIEKFRVSSIGISSSMAARLLQAGRDNPPFDLRCLEHVAFGAEMIVTPIVVQLCEKLRQMGAVNLRVSYVYGMTETGAICRAPRMGVEEISADVERKPSVGVCAPGYSLRVVDDDGKLLSEGLTGNIEVWSAEKLCKGYLRTGKCDRECFSQDGWFKTGDLGFVGGGSLTITGRQKSTITINSKKFSLELLEAPLKRLPEVANSLVLAASVRFEGSVTDELAIFFVPNEATGLDDARVKIIGEMARQGVTVQHLVPMNREAFPLTGTGKIRRDALARLYESSALKPYLPTRSNNIATELTETQKWLTRLWKDVLRLTEAPLIHDNFFELGGDSFGSAQLIVAVEEKFSRRICVESFFQRPTIARMDALIRESKELAPSAPSVNDSKELLYRIKSFSGSWQGERLFSESLLVGFNTRGHRVPIFWVCQEHREASQLAKHLGPKQPLYVMRSCAGIIPVKEYATVLEAICNRYLWEVLALLSNPIFIMGGDCQGGILALAMARCLKRVGRRPLLLVLQEWTYDYGRYTSPTLLVFGEQSYTAKIYKNTDAQQQEWMDNFPKAMVASIPGKHGELSWKDESVSGLAKLLREGETTAALLKSGMKQESKQRQGMSGRWRRAWSRAISGLTD